MGEFSRIRRGCRSESLFLILKDCLFGSEHADSGEDVSGAFLSCLCGSELDATQVLV